VVLYEGFMVSTGGIAASLNFQTFNSLTAKSVPAGTKLVLFGR
jgi:hypothetical protein